MMEENHHKTLSRGYWKDYMYILIASDATLVLGSVQDVQTPILIFSYLNFYSLKG